MLLLDDIKQSTLLFVDLDKLLDFIDCFRRQKLLLHRLEIVKVFLLLVNLVFDWSSVEGKVGLEHSKLLTTFWQH